MIDVAAAQELHERNAHLQAVLHAVADVDGHQRIESEAAQWAIRFESLLRQPKDGSDLLGDPHGEPRAPRIGIERQEFAAIDAFLRARLSRTEHLRQERRRGGGAIPLAPARPVDRQHRHVRVWRVPELVEQREGTLGIDRVHRQVLRHAAASPCAPLNAHARQPARAARLRQRVEERVGRGVGAEPWRPEERRGGREQDEGVETVRRAEDLVEGDRAVDFRGELRRQARRR